MGEQQRAEAAAEQNADERGNDRQLCAEKKARAEHQLDITAAEAAGHDERQKQHRHADDHAADQPRFYPQAGDKYVRSDAADKQQHRKPVVDFKRVHVHERHDRQNTEHGERQRRLFRALAARFRDVPLVDLHGTLRTRLLSLFWKGTVYRYPKYALTRRLFLLSGGRFGRAPLLARNVPERYAAALAPLRPQGFGRDGLSPFLAVNEDDDDWSLDALAPLVRHARPVVALHPFATHPAKAWPAAHWRELARLLADQGMAHFWIGRGDASLFASAPLTGPRGLMSLDFTNRTDLRQLIALLAQADALVTGDSGPMHLASGVSTPVVALFGPTCREWGFFPTGENDRVLQAPLACRPCSLHGKTGAACGHACMRSLTPDMVMEKLRRVLIRPPSAAPGTRADG